jgi:hypothetical protein
MNEYIEDNEEATRKELQFTEICMTHVRRAADQLSHFSHSHECDVLIEIFRALLILKTHLDDFRKKYPHCHARGGIFPLSSLQVQFCIAEVGIRG